MLACVALATVFLVSAVAKLLDRDGTREAVAGLGSRHALHRSLPQSWLRLSWSSLAYSSCRPPPGSGLC